MSASSGLAGALAAQPHAAPHRRRVRRSARRRRVRSRAPARGRSACASLSASRRRKPARLDRAAVDQRVDAVDGQARRRADFDFDLDSVAADERRPRPAKQSSPPAAAERRSASCPACASRSRWPAGSPPPRRAVFRTSCTMSGRLKLRGKARGGEKVGVLRPAAIELPADQILAAGRGHVIAGRRPSDPPSRPRARRTKPAAPARRSSAASGSSHRHKRPRALRRRRCN